MNGRPGFRRSRAIVLIITTALLALPGVAGAHQFGDWGLAVIEPNVNSTVADGCPIESPNGLELYLASNRDPIGGATDSNDIYVARRASKDDDFGAAVRLPTPVNSTAADFCPTPLTGNRLLFVSARAIAGACGVGDIYLTRNHPAKGWLTPTNLGCAATGAGPNSAGGEFSPSLVETAQGTMLFYSRPGAGGLQDVYVSQMRSDGTFTVGTPVAELNTAGFNDQMPNVSRDGREIVFVSDRPGVGGLDVYVATRASTDQAWSAPVLLGSNVNTTAAESRPSLSADGQRLHFGRLGDIWVSERVQLTGPR